MATLVLNAVGQKIGGPIGGAIGSLIGQRIDQTIFGGKGREGPRLTELDIQTSSYGTEVPAIFGKMRVAGTVIWATDLVERRNKSSSGKGRPSTINYSYSVSMSVALSSRPIASIGRIWADGNLLRGTGGDLKVDTQFRFHAGHADQPLDSLIASAEAAGQCPAYRGIAYAVFEDFQLADYGNRIPSLTFEIFERATPVPISDIMSDASAGAISGASSETLAGYAVSGNDGRAAIAPLLSVMPTLLRPKPGRLELLDWQSPVAKISHVTPVSSDGSQSLARPARTLEPTSTIPSALAIRHYEPARDFQTGIQRSQRSSAGRTSRQIDFPASVDADAALRLADLQLLQAQRGRDSWTGSVAISAEQLIPGDFIIDDTGVRWRITELEHLRGSIRVTAQAWTTGEHGLSDTANPGRNISTPDLLVGETRLIMIDMPAMGSVDPGRPQLAVFAAGTAPGWRRAALSIQQGDRLIDIGSTAAPAVIGSALTALPPHNAHLIDTKSQLDIQLLHDRMVFPDGNAPLLSSGAGVGWLEKEFFRFGSAVALGGGRWRLSQFVRGCYGSEYASSGHRAGDRFVLLQTESARLIENQNLAPGMAISVEAVGLADPFPVTTTDIVMGNAIRPLVPVHGQVVRNGDGSLEVSWIRRVRIDAGWNDGIDQALVEGGEQYTVSVSTSELILDSRVVETGTISWTAQQIAGFALPPSAQLTIAIRQIGSFALSDPLILFATINP